MTRERLLKSFLLLVCIGRTASGATILDIPSNFSPFPVNQSTYIAAVSWTSAVSAKNVTLSVLMQNAAPFTQSAKAYLTKRFGPGTIQANDEIAETTFSVPPSIEGGLYEITLFRDMYLPAGDCYLTIVGPQAATWDLSWATGNGPISGTASQTFSYASQGAGVYSDLAPYPPASSFGQISTNLATTVIGDLITSAPAPIIYDDGVVNAASNAPLRADRGFAQGSLFSIYGVGLGPSSAVIATALPFGNILAGVSVRITPSKGRTVQPYLLFVSGGQINAILPSNTPLGPASITVTYNSTSSNTAGVQVVQSNFGIFTVASGSGPSIAQNYKSPTDVTMNTLTNAAAPGQVVILYGTGLGPIKGPDNTVPGAVSPHGVTAQVILGGQSLNPTYAGRAPQLPGVDEIKFQIPSDASTADGCFVPIAIEINGALSNFGTIAKATGTEACPAPLGLSKSAIARLAGGGSVSLGLLNLLTESSYLTQGVLFDLPVNGTTEVGEGIFSTFSLNQLFALSASPGTLPPFNPPGTCVMETLNSSSLPGTTIPPVSNSFDAGNTLVLTGPNSKIVALYQDQSHTTFYAADMPVYFTANGADGFFEPGSWSITGSGGSGVGPFTAATTLPAPVQCSNCGAIGDINRTSPLVVNWTGGGSDKDYVEVVGYSSIASAASAKTVSVMFECAARASDQTLTVPSSVLSQMPQSSGDITSSNFGALLFIDGLGSPDAVFTAPLTTGGNLDFGYFGHTTVATHIVGYN